MQRHNPRPKKSRNLLLTESVPGSVLTFDTAGSNAGSN